MEGVGYLNVAWKHSESICHSPLPTRRACLQCRGLKQRQQDELRIKEILNSKEAQVRTECSIVFTRRTFLELSAFLSSSLFCVTDNLEKNARENRDHVQLNELMQKLNDVAYGINVSPQTREEFLQAYGCCAYTDDILDYLVEEFGHRGLVEIGAGNGQWARALSDRYQAKNIHQSDDRSNWDFVLAYDTMEELPLSPQIYNSKTKPYQDYFYAKVQRCKSHEDEVRNFTSRGRVLLLVYPSPGSWPLEALKAYVDATAGTSDAVNDKLVYVGEGRLGANCNDEFFDYLLTGGWKVERIMDVKASPGGKGFERLYVLTKVPSNT